MWINYEQIYIISACRRHGSLWHIAVLLPCYAIVVFFGGFPRLLTIRHRKTQIVGKYRFHPLVGEYFCAGWTEK